MKKAVVIANPSASQFTGGSHRDVMAILNRDFSLEAVWPSSGSDAAEASWAAVEDGASLVVAMGGDGVVHHVAQGLIGTEARLGIIPAGTTNVISRIFNVPSNPTKAAKMIAAGYPPQLAGTLRMDVTHGTNLSSHHSLFACGLGLDADVVIEADKEPYRKYRFGSIHYAKTALGVALKKFPKKRPHVLVTSGDRTGNVSAIVFQFREIYTYFGRIPLALSQNEPDPVTALLLDRLRRRRIPFITTRIFTRGELGDLPELEIWENVESLTAKADPPVAAQADGESLGMIDEATFTWTPDSIRILGGQESL